MGGTRRTSLVHAQRIEVAARRRTHATRLRVMGLSFQAIADSTLPCPEHAPHGDPTCRALGHGCLPMYAHRKGAQEAVRSELEQEYQAGQADRERLRAEQLAQLDALIEAAMPAAVREGTGQWKAQDSVLKALDRRAKLLGLDAPTRVQVSDEMDEEIRGLVSALIEMPAGPVE